VTDASAPLLLCPECRNVLPIRPPCACGFILREFDGIIDLLSAADATTIQPFLDAYDRVRAAEQWGGDDLDLPFHPKRHHDIWNIRQRTFRAFAKAIQGIPRGVAVDLGAGNCWLSRYLDEWGFDAVALDVNTSDMDGLRAGRKFLDSGAVFLRVRASMKRLPFDSSRIRLLATNASFHYAHDFRATLTEFKRVLTPGGIIAIVDTPFYDKPADGEYMMDQRVREFREKYDITETMARMSRYMTYTQLNELASTLSLNLRIQRVWPGTKRTLEKIRAQAMGRHIAEFPLVLMEKK
jgi:ubiquinone/menaquinone biosynthesis C-methylase UbiE